MKPIEKIYLAFYTSKKKKLYFNELKEISGLKDSSLNKNLLNLIELDEIVKEKTKQNTFYSLKNQELKASYFTKFSINRFNKLNFKIKNPLNKFKEEIKNIKFIIHFGSSSRNEEKKESDIDLLIVLNNFEDKKLNKLYTKEIKTHIEELKNKINATSIYPISCFYVNYTDFKNSSSDDNLIFSAKNTGYPIYNQIEYYK